MQAQVDLRPIRVGFLVYPVLDTGKRLLEVGTDVLVAGNFVFKSENPVEMITKLKML